ncbi:MAG: hypothetical protein P8J87_02495, partial [Verrucomicrobiales bacterium]|nr:hypothetical protein [Verrucomicrobiales bacterium]
MMGEGLLGSGFENRVRMGGHAIPADVVRRRFSRGLENLGASYLGVVDEWSIYDTSGGPVRLVETGGDPRAPRMMDDHLCAEVEVVGVGGRDEDVMVVDGLMRFWNVL